MTGKKKEKAENHEIRKLIAEPIKIFRKNYDVSNADIATAIGVKLTTVNSWFRNSETYGIKPRTEHIINLNKWAYENFSNSAPPYTPINFIPLFWESGKTPYEEKLIEENAILKAKLKVLSKGDVNSDVISMLISERVSLEIEKEKLLKKVKELEKKQKQ